MVSLRAILAENRGTPFACNFYQPETDSCIGVSQYQLRGDAGIEIGRLALNGRADSYLEAMIPFEVRDGSICADGAKAQLTIKGKRPYNAGFLLNTMRGLLRKQGVMCDTFYRAQGGGYIVVTKNSQGKTPLGGEVHMQFFAAPKALRRL